jgi:outer membrane protein assembly factor BamB
MKFYRKERIILMQILVVVLIALMSTTGIQAQPENPPIRIYLPRFLKNSTLTAPPKPLVDPVWRWGDINLAPGSKGILVTDLDGDGQNEVLTAHSQLLIALRATGQYRFSQIWAIPMGVSWGVADIMDMGSNQVWVAYQDGLVLVYRPYTYSPLALAKLNLPSGATLRQALVTDIVGDAKQELLVWTSNGELIAYNIPQFSQVWRYQLSETGDEFYTPSILVAQVDDDPAQEIIVSSGYVIDPLLRTEQWRYNDGFGTVIRAGDVDGDGRQEIVGMSDWSYITAFDADVQSPKWQITTADNDTIELADVVGDALPEILLGEGQWGSIQVYDAVTQNLLWSVNNPEHGVSGIGVGDADNDGELDLIWGAGWTSTGPDHLYLTPISRRNYTFAFPDYDGPYSAVALPMDEDDTLELVVFTASTNSGYDNGTYFVLDSASGVEQLELTLGIDRAPFSQRWAVLPANVDGDPYQELILGVGDDLYMLDHNGSRLVKRSFSEPYEPDWVGDVDGDGQLELVSHSSSRINIHQLDTLALEWQSINLRAGVANVAVGDVDGDGHVEIVFHGPNSYLQAYDGQTRLLKWQMPSTQRASAVAIGNADRAGNLEIATIEEGRIVFYDGVTRRLIRRTARLDLSGYGDISLTFVQMTTSTYPQLVVAIPDKVLLFEHPYDENPTQTLGHLSATITFADTDNDHHLDLLVGDHLGITRYRTRSEFPDVVPPVARAITPRAGADLVARNAFAEAGFNEEMDPSTMVAANAQLRVGDMPIAADLSYDSGTRVLRITPLGLLPANASVTVWLGPGLRDLAGNGLDGNLNGIGGEANDAYTWQFTTGSGVDDAGPVILNLTLSPNPAWSGMPVVISADADDTHPAAASTVRRAEYFLNTLGVPGTGRALRAVDGRFDSRREAIGTILDTTGWSGVHTIYVRAEDSVGNWGTAVSTTLEIHTELAANWPQFGHNAAHTGYNAAQPRVKGFAAAWEIDLFALFGHTSVMRPLQQVAVANGLVVANVDSYFGNAGIVALKASDGSELWRFPFSNKHSVNPPSIAYGTVYFQQGNHGNDTYLFALNALTGRQVWRSPFQAQWERYFAPTVADGKVFINGGYYGGMYAFDAFDGDQLWFANLPQYDEWTPAYRDNVVYSWVEGVLKAWDPRWGTERWSTNVGWNWRGWSMGRIAALSTTTAYVITNSGAGADLVAIDLTTHAEKWRQIGAFTVSVAVTENEVYGLDGTRLRVFDADTGAELWSYDAGVTLINSPLVTAGNVYFAAADRTWVLDRTKPTLVWETSKGGWLTVANDQLFIAQPNGRLAAFNALK